MRRFTTLAAVAALAPGALWAQGDSVPTPGTGALPPIRRIESATSVSTEQIGAITGVRELPDGRVLLNDGARRRLVLLDTTLAVTAVVLDSLTEVENSYGTRPGILVPYRADTTLFIDPASYVILVIDPQGRVTRVRSVWSVRDMNALTRRGPGRDESGPTAIGVDARGRIVYQVSAQVERPRGPRPRGVPVLPTPPDSAFVVAVDIDARTVDTVGVLRIPKTELALRMNRGGGYDVSTVLNPLPSSDDWAVLPDGVIAFVRARDYRIEYRDGDGRVTSSPKIPFPWQHLPEEERERLVDSVRTAQERTHRTAYTTSMIRWVNMHGKAYPDGFTAPEGYRPPQGFGRDWRLPPGVTFPPRYIHGCAAGEEATMEGGRPSCIPMPVADGNVPPMPVLRDVRVMAAADLPDYRPPLASTGSTLADADGNLWIRTVQPTPVAGGPVYDIVSREGTLVDRIQIPTGYTLVGFGRGKVVYLAMRNREGPKLARVRLR